MNHKAVSPANLQIASQKGFNNVFGVVMEACYKYICERAARAPATRVAPDVLTYVPFNHAAKIAIDAWPHNTNTAPRVLSEMLQKKAKGGTNFNEALTVAYKHLKQVRLLHILHAWLPNATFGMFQ
jgi:hypothetical protein